MRRLLIAAAVVLVLPAACFALAFCVTGNEPQSAENYTEWPGLVDVVNDESRVSLCWVNGDETLCYRGDMAALNRVLNEFAEVEADERHLILLPAPGPGVAEDVGKQDPDLPADWHLHIVGGITRAVAREWELESVFEIQPTLRVYISDRIPLGELDIPAGIKLQQRSDLRQRYEDAVADGNDRAREFAARALEQLDTATPKAEADAAEYNARLKAIGEFVRERQTEPSSRGIIP
jgi:hypothetical protein